MFYLTLYYDARKHKIKIKLGAWLVSQSVTWTQTKDLLLQCSFCALRYIKTLVTPTNAQFYSLCILPIT